MYAIAKKELSDRNWRAQENLGYPNIPEGAEVWVYYAELIQGRQKYVPVMYNNYNYTVKLADLKLMKV